MITFADAVVGLGHISHLLKPRYWKLKRPIFKGAFPFGFFDAPPTYAQRVISIIPQPQQFVNRQNQQNNHQRKSRICATLPVDFWFGLWYTIIVKRERKLWRECSARIRRSSADNNRAKKVEKISISLLRNHPSCDTIRVQNADGVRRLRRVPRCATPPVRVWFSHLWLVSSVESAKG